MNRIPGIAASLIMVICSAAGLKAQNASDLSQSRSVYQAAAASQAALYTGTVEEAVTTATQGHPFFLSDEFQTGSLKYQGLIYENVRLRLHTIREELTLQTPNRSLSIVLDPKNLEYAFIKDAKLHYVTEDEMLKGLPRGYVILLHEGAHPLIWKCRKHIHNDIENRRAVTYYTQKDQYYLLKDGLYHSIGSKGSLLKLFPQEKKQLKAFIKSQGLDFGKEYRQEAILRTLEYLETL